MSHFRIYKDNSFREVQLFKVYKVCVDGELYDRCFTNLDDAERYCTHERMELIKEIHTDD